MFHQRGFTLVELLVVISIISLLSSIVMVNVSSARSKARVTAAAAEIHELNKVFITYQLDHNGKLPCLDTNSNFPNNDLYGFYNYISWPTNPWGGAYKWIWSYHFSVFMHVISIINVPSADAQSLDTLIDDGNLNTGLLRVSINTDPGKLEWGDVDQTAPSTTVCLPPPLCSGIPC